jgi:hypothetical protein
LGSASVAELFCQGKADGKLKINPRYAKIGFRVTAKALKHAGSQNNQKQIALSIHVGGAAQQGRLVSIRLNDLNTTLVAGDSHAIFRSHLPPESLALFDRLYHLLSLFPDKYLRFDCTIEDE